MRTKLSWSSDFLAIVVCEEKMYANNYTCKLHLSTASTDTRHQTVAFERAKTLLMEVFNGSVIIGGDNPLLDTMISLCGERLIILPEEAYDQIVNAALFCKINSVLEGVMTVDRLCLSSKIGGDVIYQFEEGDSLGPFESAPKKQRKKKVSWWHRPDISTVDSKDAVQPTSWEDLGLGWEEPEAEIIFTPEKNGDIIDMDSKKQTKLNVEIFNGGGNDESNA